MTTNTPPNGDIRDSPRSQLRYLPRLLGFIWRAEPGMFVLLVLISTVAGLLVVAQVHALRRLVETAQEVIQGGAPLIDRRGLGRPNCWDRCGSRRDVSG